MTEPRGMPGAWYRRSIMAMAMIAVAGYIIAFVQSDKGAVHYNYYVAAYTECFIHVLENGAEQTDCNLIPEVRVHLVAHREAFAVGEPFLNLALALTAAVLVSPLLRKFTNKISKCIHLGSCSSAAEDPA